MTRGQHCRAKRPSPVHPAQYDMYQMAPVVPLLACSRPSGGDRCHLDDGPVDEGDVAEAGGNLRVPGAAGRFQPVQARPLAAPQVPVEEARDLVVILLRLGCRDVRQILRVGLALP